MSNVIINHIIINIPKPTRTYTCSNIFQVINWDKHVNSIVWTHAIIIK